MIHGDVSDVLDVRERYVHDILCEGQWRKYCTSWIGLAIKRGLACTITIWN